MDNLKNFEKGNQYSVGHGRPKGKSWTTMLREASEANMTKKWEGQIQTKTAGEWACIRAVNSAVNGDFKFFQEVKNSLDGKPILKLEAEVKENIDVSELSNEQLKFLMDQYLGKSDE